jgi:hypothetical protein
MVLLEKCNAGLQVFDGLAMGWKHKRNMIKLVQLLQGAQVLEKVIGMGGDGVEEYVSTQQDSIFPFIAQN